MTPKRRHATSDNSSDWLGEYKLLSSARHAMLAIAIGIMPMIAVVALRTVQTSRDTSTSPVDFAVAAQLACGIPIVCLLLCAFGCDAWYFVTVMTHIMSIEQKSGRSMDYGPAASLGLERFRRLINSRLLSTACRFAMYGFAIGGIGGGLLVRHYGAPVELMVCVLLCGGLCAVVIRVILDFMRHSRVIVSRLDELEAAIRVVRGGKGK